MKISVKVKPNAKRKRVEKIDDGNFLVWVKEKPMEGKANKAVIEALAGYFGIAKSKVILLKGMASRQKVFKINTNREVSMKKLLLVVLICTVVGLSLMGCAKRAGTEHPAKGHEHPTSEHPK